MPEERVRIPLSLWLAVIVASLTLVGALLINESGHEGTVAAYVVRADTPALRVLTKDDVTPVTIPRSKAHAPVQLVIGSYLLKELPARGLVTSQDLGVLPVGQVLKPGDTLVGAPASSAQVLGGALVPGTLVRVRTAARVPEQAVLTVLLVERSSASTEPPYVLVLAVPKDRLTLASALARGAFELAAPIRG